MTTTFETALDRHEISEFFKGEGIYFARGSDWGDHLYISNWQEMCGFLKNQKAAQSLLTSIFDDYVKYLEENYLDAHGLLSNISAYYILRKKLPLLSDNQYDLIESLDKKSKKNIGVLFRLLRKEYDKKAENLQKYTFEEEILRLKNNGCKANLESL
ncbi:MULTISPECIES: hypothetical protein [Pseudomonas syringae group]|uniref:Uncharacterized protein n=3 Tax=Pseudomonas syringae group TaxID=136849 RepID=A0A0Q0DI99_9PSED|nr:MULTISPECIES: hypothetical protein [Pseudomonas syringae group]MCF9018902.1 hypothetical protein [Pseudomonas syringae]EKN46198.1 hypothetical protein AAI_12764 [Pseudomonas viridiflava UASWS0038]KPL64399.1 hypothetical protein PVFL_12280 [Pseudomonas viridiflava]KPY38850.1 Uncharacterized protein ALO52_00021 [Pseudomonas syringae pv. primulae]MCQ9393495.1 hypothetical protein [Pseudomonas viridiflava]